jgi:hypothetical protein
MASSILCRTEPTTARPRVSAYDVDTDHNGVISMAELTAYVEKHLSHLTGGEQQLGLDQRFQGDIFVAGL